MDGYRGESGTAGNLIRSYDSFRGAFAFFASKFHLDG
jgi:hypothetical protein